MSRILKNNLLCFCAALLIVFSGLSRELQAQSYQFNGSAYAGSPYSSSDPVNGYSSLLVLTDGKPFEAGSAFRQGLDATGAFDATFTYINQDANADGFAYVIQANGSDALGSPGGGIGYGNPPGQTGASIINSLAIVFDLHNNQGEGSNSIRLENNGVTIGSGAIDLTPSGINLHNSNHHFDIHIQYFSENLEVFITDRDSPQQNSFYTDWIVSIAKLIGGPMAYFGFTGSTGANAATQMIQSFIFDGLGGGLSTPSYPRPSFPDGFADATGLQLNGGASISGSDLVLTHGKQFEATSAYFNQQLPLHDVNAPNDDFYIDFNFQIANGAGDGFTLVLQDDKLTAVGPTGGGLGYGPYVYIVPPNVSMGQDTCISEAPGGPALGPLCPGGGIQHSLAVKFDLHNNQGEGINSTGFYFNGLSPTIPAIDLTPSGIDLHSGHTFHVRIGTVGDPGNSDLTLTITDLDVYKVFTTTQHIAAGTATSPFSLLPANAWAGFTAATGATPSNITIKNWFWDVI